MVKKSVKAEFNTFVKGLITEASPLNFPENASFDEENFELNRDGSRDRRFGLDFENGFAYRPLPFEDSLIKDGKYNTYLWENAGGIPGKSLIVVQFDRVVFVYDSAKIPTSTAGVIGFVELPVGESLSITSFASVGGKLVAVNGSGEINIITYDPAVGLAVESRRLMVRDQWGVYHATTENDPSLRVSIATNAHIYNLYNQSWGIPRRNEGDVALVDPMVLFRTTYSIYPSENETVWPALQLQPVSPPNVPRERLFINLLQEQTGINTKAAKGYFIIDLLRRGVSRTQAIESNAAKYPELELKTFNAPSDFTSGGATVICEFAGRVFYSGFSGATIDGDIRSPDLSNYVVFSQLVKSNADITKCYQDGDPTSREGNDVVDTDGGVIPISGADGIYHMQSMGSSLLVFCRNGVWAISGGSDFGFTATNYKVERITRAGTTSPYSVVEEVNKVFYWSEDGIYVVARNQFGQIEASNISEQTIQSYYQSIPAMSKMNARGVYDLSKRTVRWLYSTGECFTAEHKTYELVFDSTLGAFYRNRIYNASSVNGPIALSGFQSSPFRDENEFEPILAGTEEVYVQIRPVVATRIARKEVVQTTKFLCAIKVNNLIQFTFASYGNTEFKDWELYDSVGNDAAAYLVTGAITAGDSSVAKQAPYITTHMKKTEIGFTGEFEPIGASSCFVRAQWGFTNSASSNKWGPLFQIYRHRRAFIPANASSEFDNGDDLVTTKNKLRGRGRALSLRMETEPGKDCRIVGWTLSLNGNSIV